MKKLILGLSLVASISSWAQDDAQKKQPKLLNNYAPREIDTKPGDHSEIGFGLNYTSFDYQEELTPPSKSTEKGSFPVLYAGMRIPIVDIPGSQVFLEGEAMLGAPLKYDGTTLTTNLPITASDKGDFLKVEAAMFFNLSGQKETRFGPVVGYGIRYWKRYLTYGTGYNEIYTWSYLPLGFSAFFEMSSDVQFGFEIRYNYMISGSIKVITSETIVNGEDTTLTLGNKNGYRITLPFDIKLNEKMKLKVMPWSETSAIGASDIKYNSSFGSAIQEPASKTVQYGLLGALFFTL